jgi:hypothetical protein
MKSGSYQKARSFKEIHDLQTLKFRPHIFKGVKHDKLRGTCGTNAFSTLTGLKPVAASELLAPTATHWRDRPMRKALARLGYKTLPVTMCDVTNEKGWIKYPIRRFHVLLVSQLMTRNEGSWSVIHRNRVYHNMDEAYLDPLEFLNNPLMTVYIVWNKKWLVKNPQIFSGLEDPLFNAAQFRGGNLRQMQLHNLVGYSPRYYYANMR